MTVSLKSNLIRFPYLKNVAPENQLTRAMEVYLKEKGKTAKGVEEMIIEYHLRDPLYFPSVIEKKGFDSLRAYAEYIAG